MFFTISALSNRFSQSEFKQVSQYLLAVGKLKTLKMSALEAHIGTMLLFAYKFCEVVFYNYIKPRQQLGMLLF